MYPGGVGIAEAGQIDDVAVTEPGERREVNAGAVAHVQAIGGDRRRAGELSTRAGLAGEQGVGEAHFGQGRVFVVLDAHRNRATGDVGLGGERLCRAIRPGIDDQLVVDPDTHAVIAGGGEAIAAGGQAEVGRPAGGEVIDGNLGRRCAIAPVVVDGRFIAHDDRLAAKVHVVIVLGAPRGGGGWRHDGHALPTQPRLGPLGVLEVLHLDRDGSTGHVYIDGVAGRRLHAPLVDDQNVVDPQPHAVIGDDGETVAASIQVQVAHPTHREEVGREAGGGRAKPPVEVDVGGGSGQRRRAAEAGVGEVLVEPVAGGCGRRRRIEGHVTHAGHSHAARLVVLHGNGMVARAQKDVGGDAAHLAVIPGVDDEHVIDPDAHAIVGRGREAIGSRRQADRLRPLGGEVVGEDLRRRRTTAPVEIDARVLAYQNRIARQVAVVPVATFPRAALGAEVKGAGGQRADDEDSQNGDEEDKSQTMEWKPSVHEDAPVAPRPGRQTRQATTNQRKRPRCRHMT